MSQHWTPNQAARREAIVTAAVEVLRTQGVAACTVRAIASVGPLTKSSLHYYFDDVDEIVDLAFRRLMEQFIDRVEKAAGDAADPTDALWSAAATYLRLGADRPDSRRVPMLWFDYQVASTRRGDTTTALALTERARSLFARLVAATGATDAVARGGALFAALAGTLAFETMAVEPRPTEEALAELAIALQLPAPLRPSER